MSDEPKPAQTPSAPTSQDAAPASTTAVPATPTEAPALPPSPAEAKPAAAGQTPAATGPSRPPIPIDYAMPAQKTFIPSPALIRNVGCLIKLIAGFTVLICMGYFALVALNPKARQWALQGSKPGPGGAPATGKGPTPFKVVNQILAIPAQALGKTDDVVKANNARVGQLDGLVAEEETNAKGGGSSRSSRPVIDPFSTPSSVGGTSRPDNSAAGATEAGPQAVSSAAMLALAEKRAAAAAAAGDPAGTPLPPTPKPAVVAPPAPDTPEEMKLPGGIIIAQASPNGAPRASAAFFFWVVKLNVSGITQSKPARLLLNNRLTYEGDEVNRPLGIVFAQLDPANKLLVFKDATGATVTRSY